MARRRAAEHAEARTPAAHHPDAIDGAEGRRALSRLGHARWRPAGSMVADLLSAPPASSAEPAGSDRRALVPQRALPELVLATRGQAEHPGARGALSVSDGGGAAGAGPYGHRRRRSEEHTSELQSLMRISYAVFCLK